MKKILLALSLMICCSGMAQEKPDTMWVQFDDRFVENEIIDLTHIDSLEFQTSTYKLYKYYRKPHLLDYTHKWKGNKQTPRYRQCLAT